MTNKTTEPTIPRPLPIRVARLHAKLLLAVAVGIAVAFATMTFEMRVPARMLIGWDVGIAFYLALTLTMMRRADVARIRKRAAEQDEGAAAILVLSIIATF